MTTFSSARSLAALMVLLLVSGAMAPEAGAATIQVTTKADLVANDGLCSLREAIGAANANLPSGNAPGECQAGDPDPTVDLVRVPRGKFKLTLGGPGEDLNAEGDLDVTESVDIEGAGGRRTTIESAIGSRRTLGDGDRIFHIDPLAADGVHVLLRGLGLRKGDVGCTGSSCVAKGSAVEAEGDGNLTLDDCHVSKNSVTCTGAGCGQLTHGAAVRARHSASVLVLNSVLEKNQASCDAPRCRAGAAALIAGSGQAGMVFGMTRTRIGRNVTRCGATSCDAISVVKVLVDTVIVDESVIERNRVACDGEQCNAERLAAFSGLNGVDVSDSRFTGNVLTCTGADCEAERGLELSSGQGATTLGRTVIAKNRGSCVGEACDAGRLAELHAIDALAHGTSASRNLVTCTGVGCEAEYVLELRGSDTASLAGVDVSRNTARCRGDACDASRVLNVVPNVVTLEDVVAERNRLGSRGVDSEAGRVIQVSASDATLTGVRASQNRSECADAECDARTTIGVSASAAFSITAGVFHGNRMACKGDLCSADGTMAIFGGTGTMANSSVVANAATCRGAGCRTEHGGGLLNEAAMLTIDDSLLAANVVSGDGGAIVNQSDAVLVLSETTLRENRAGGRGGAIANHLPPDPNDGTPILVVSQSEISDNSAEVDAGGISNEGVILEISAGSTLASNSPNDCVDTGAGTGCP